MEDLIKIRRRAKKELEEKKAKRELEETNKKKKAADILLNRPREEKIFKEDSPEVSLTEEELEIKKLLEQLKAEIKKEKLNKDKDNWDVKADELIECFDPHLSYQLTGYRPITMTQGLDFDPEPFCRAGQIYSTTGAYTTLRPGSKAYADFWKEEKRRCVEGYTIGRYTITGDHYFFLNYYRLLNVKGMKKAGAGRTESFPDFYAKQYEYFHYILMCEMLGRDVGALKARGVGFSEIAASLGARMYTTTRQSICVYAAFSDFYVDKVLLKCWLLLEFLNTQTLGGFKHLRQGKSTERERRASVIDKEGNETGHGAVITGVTIDKPRKLRGDRVERLFFEESGSNPTLVTTYNQSEALVVINGERLGTRFVWGTGGDSGVALAGLSKMYYNPEAFAILPYKNYHTQSGEPEYTAFFVPAYTMVVKYCDNRGVCDEIQAKQYYNTERLKKSNDPQNLLEYKSEYCFYAEEALIREGENRFDSVKLAEQLANIELHKLVEKPKRANLTFPFNPDLGKPDMDQIPTLEYTSNGKLEIVEEPMKDDKGIPYSNLYVIGVDGIDADSSTSTGQKDVSLFAIIVKRRQIGLQDPCYVAYYKDRPNDVREAFDMVIKLCMYYNAKVMVEATRVSVITYMKEHKKQNYLFRRPTASMPTNSRVNVRLYGCPASQSIIEHQLDLIANFVLDYYYTINSVALLLELIKYSYENKKKFDLVAACGMCELADEELQTQGRIPKSENQYKSLWKDIGYYTDEYGIKRYGVIPEHIEPVISIEQQRYYSWLNLV